jgi:hypothetical protein
MAGLYSHTVFGDPEPFLKELKPSAPKVVEFSGEAAQAKREDRSAAGAVRRDELLTAARVDGLQAGFSAGWRRGFWHGVCIAVVLALVVATFMFRK